MRKKLAAIAIVAGVGLAASAAFAYWTTGGTGSGTGATQDATENLSFDQADLTPFFPGDDAQDLTVTVTNNDETASVYVGHVWAWVEVAPAAEAACGSGDFLLNGAAAPGSEANAVELSWIPGEIVAGEDADATGTIQFNDLDSNQDGCKNADLTLHYFATETAPEASEA